MFHRLPNSLTTICGDTEAIIEVVSSGSIAGAPIYVFPIEPPNRKDLERLNERIIAAPHIAGITEETNLKLALSTAEQVVPFFQGIRPKNILNETAWNVHTS